MVRGQYIAGTGMLLQRRKMETITNNITNVETTGYKKDHLVSRSFDDVLIERRNDTAVVGLTQMVGPLDFGTRVDQIYTNYETGNFEETSRSTDMALVGDVFFTLSTPGGERYSKAGAFLINSQGFLTDGEGHFLLGNNGPVYVGSEDFSVDERGNVFVDDQVINSLRIVTFADNENLRKQGSNLYFTVDGEQPVQAQECVVKQGFLENSNVEVAREMVDMMTVYRVYETNQRMLSMIDETVGKAVNEIGRLR